MCPLVCHGTTWNKSQILCQQLQLQDSFWHIYRSADSLQLRSRCTNPYRICSAPRATQQRHSGVASLVSELQRRLNWVSNLNLFQGVDPRYQIGILIVCTKVFDLDSQARSKHFGTPKYLIWKNFKNLSLNGLVTGIKQQGSRIIKIFQKFQT